MELRVQIVSHHGSMKWVMAKDISYNDFLMLGRSQDKFSFDVHRILS
jgi:hypothetical protein